MTRLALPAAPPGRSTAQAADAVVPGAAVLIVLGVVVLAGVLWVSSYTTARGRDRMRFAAAAVALVALVVGCVLTDFPLTSGAAFWAEHALLTGVLTTCALLGLGYVFVDRHERQQERERAADEQRRQAELRAQSETIVREMTRSVVSDVFLACTVFRGSGAGSDLDAARDAVVLQREVVTEALDGARTWFVALSGTQSAGSTAPLAMLADYMVALRGADYDARVFTLNAGHATTVTPQLRRAMAEIETAVDLADSIVRRFVAAEGMDYDALVVEEFTRRHAPPS